MDRALNVFGFVLIGLCVTFASCEMQAASVGEVDGGNLLGRTTTQGSGPPLEVPFSIAVSEGLSGITAPVRVYVAPNGSNSNPCTSSAPCATLQHALTVGTKLLNTGGESLYIKMAAGAYTQSFFVNGPLTGMVNSAPNPDGSNTQAGQVVVEGDGSASTTLTGGAYCGTIVSSNSANVAVRALKVNGNAVACQSTLFGQMLGMLHILDDVDFGPASIEHIHLENGAQLQAWFSYKISGDALRHITTAQSSMYLHSAYPSGTISFVGLRTFPYQFVWATQGATAQWNENAEFSGSFTGTRYAVTANGNIHTPSTLLTWIPGTAAGYSASGGVYQGPSPEVFSGAMRTDGAGQYSAAGCSDVAFQQCDGAVWVPSLQFLGASTGITYSNQIGRYFRFNKLITATFDITLTSKGSATGSAGIGGLPFPGYGSGVLSGCTIGYYANMIGIVGFAPYINSNNTAIALSLPGDTQSNNYTDANFTNTTRITGSCTYVTG